MDPSVISTVLKLLVTNGSDINTIEQKIGGFSNIISLGEQIGNLWTLYQSGGVNAVLSKGGPTVQTIIEKIGPANIAAVMPPAASILSAYQSQGKSPS